MAPHQQEIRPVPGEAKGGEEEELSFQVTPETCWGLSWTVWSAYVDSLLLSEDISIRWLSTFSVDPVEMSIAQYFSNGISALWCAVCWVVTRGDSKTAFLSDEGNSKRHLVEFLTLAQVSAGLWVPLPPNTHALYLPILQKASGLWLLIS